MKLIHCADLHLDSRLANLPEEQAKVRRTELLGTFLRLTDYAEREKAAAVLISGDLFDTAVVSRQAKNTFLDAVRRHPGILFFYLRGNHDRSGFAGEEIPENLKCFGETWKTYTLEDPGELPVEVTGAELTAENAAVLPETLSLDPHAFHLVMLHGQIRDTSSGSGALTIPLAKYRNRNIGYLALGHIHAFEEGPLAPDGIWCYPGCLEPRGYDECGKHGFVVLETGRTFRHRFVPFSAREFHELPVDVTGCSTTGEMAEQVRRILSEQEKDGKKIPASDFVKIVLRGRVDADAEKNPLLLEQQFAGCFSGVRVEDRTLFSVRYEDYLMEPTLKGEFVRLVRSDGTLDEEEKAEIIRCGIQALSGEEMDQ